MIFFSMGVGGDRVELAGGKMNVLSCLRWLSHVLLLRTWPQSAWCVDYFLATFCPVLAGFTASSDNLSPQGIWKTFPLFFFLPPPMYYCYSSFITVQCYLTWDLHNSFFVALTAALDNVVRFWVTCLMLPDYLNDIAMFYGSKDDMDFPSCSSFLTTVQRFVLIGTMCWFLVVF